MTDLDQDGKDASDAGLPMRLRVFLPTHVLVDQAVVRVVADAENGAFGILPRHVDFVTALQPSILLFEPAADGGERFVGHDVGIFVKRGTEVMVSTRNAVLGDNLPKLRSMLERELLVLDQHEQAARSALARLEAAVVRRFMELEEWR